MSAYRALTPFDLRGPIRVDTNPFELLGELSEKENQVYKYTKAELLSMRASASDLTPQELAQIKSCSVYRNNRPVSHHVHRARTHGHKHRRDHSYARHSPVDKQRKIEAWFQNRTGNHLPSKI